MSRRVDGFLLSDEETAHLAASRGFILDGWRRQGLVPPVIERLLDALLAEARRAQGAAPSSNFGSELDIPTSKVRRSEWVGVAEVAARLDVSDEFVGQLLRSGRLVGQKRGRGRGIWDVEADSIERYLAERDQRRRA